MKAIRASCLSFNSDPRDGSDVSCWDWFADGGLLIDDQGRIASYGPWADLVPQLGPAVQQIDRRGQLLLPGFIDTHVHGAQMDVIASYGTQLLDWLERYTFPAELKFAQFEHATHSAKLFISELLRHGTTCAAVWPTVHPQSVDALFTEAASRNMRLIAGKVLMDQHCPDGLRDFSVSVAEHQCRALIERWHKHKRLSYALTPRFAVATSEPLMRMAGQLFADIPGLYMQNHVAENHAEIAWVRSLYPQARSYLDVYAQMGFLAKRSIFAHCLWFDEADWRAMQASGSSIAFCPTSNLFLGSGLFDCATADAHQIPIGLATDVGGGTSLSMLRTMAEAYKVLQMRGQTLNPFKAFYLSTLGGARALDIHDRVGRLQVGYEADLVVLNWSNDPLSKHRASLAKALPDQLFALMTLGDDRNVTETYVMGALVEKPVTKSTARH